MGNFEINNVLAGRKSVRKFKNVQVPEKDIIDMVKAASEAPSASHQQMWYFAAVKNKGKIDEIAKAVEEKIDYYYENIEDEELKPKVEKYMKRFGLLFKDAPLVFAVFYKKYDGISEKVINKLVDNDKEFERLTGHADIQSVSAGIQNLLLSAYEKGYGSCWMVLPLIAAKEIESILEIDDEYRLMALVPVGLADEDNSKPPRKPLEDIYKIV